MTEKFSSSTLPLRCFLQMIDLSPKKVEIFNETFEDSVEHETSIFDSVDESQTLNSTYNDPVEEITTEGAVKMEIQEGSISKKRIRIYDT